MSRSHCQNRRRSQASIAALKHVLLNDCFFRSHGAPTVKMALSAITIACRVTWRTDLVYSGRSLRTELSKTTGELTDAAPNSVDGTPRCSSDLRLHGWGRRSHAIRRLKGRKFGTPLAGFGERVWLRDSVLESANKFNPRCTEAKVAWDLPQVIPLHCDRL